MPPHDPALWEDASNVRACNGFREDNSHYFHHYDNAPFQHREESTSQDVNVPSVLVSEHKEGALSVHSQRSVLVQTSPVGNGDLQSQCPGRQEKNQPEEEWTNRSRLTVLEWIDDHVLACLCTPCSSSLARRDEKYQSTTVLRHTVYPIAKYPGGHLNSPYLVEKRRKAFKGTATFRPVIVGAE